MTDQHGYTPQKDALTRRMKRIEGQVRGIGKMIDDDKYCIDILTQISALNSALENVALGLLDDHLRHCVVDAAPRAETKPRSSSRRPPTQFDVSSSPE